MYINEYLLNTTLSFRVGTVAEALALRDKLSKNSLGELTNFSYTTKFIKVKGEIVEEYQVVKAKIDFTPEKEPEQQVEVEYFIKGSNSDCERYAEDF